MNMRAGSQALCKILTKYQMFGSEPVLVLLFCLHLNVNSNLSLPGESSDSQAVLLFLSVPMNPVFLAAQAGKKTSKKGKKAIHKCLKLWRYWKVCSLLKGTDLKVTVWERVAPGILSVF